jgi:GAF domain-containing protein
VRRLYIDLLRRQNEANRKLIEISRKLLNSRISGIEAAIDNCLQDLGEFMDVDRTFMFLIDDSGITISNTNEWCREGVTPQKDNLQKQDLQSAPAMIAKLLKQEMVAIDDLSDLDSGWQDDSAVLQAQGIQALLAAPIVHEDRIMGFIGFDLVRHTRHWDEVDFMLIQLTADLLAASLARI